MIDLPDIKIYLTYESQEFLEIVKHFTENREEIFKFIPVSFSVDKETKRATVICRFAGTIQ